MQRTLSAEINAIRSGLRESPPPAPSGTTIREWFAGLALANPALMAEVRPENRAAHAVNMADQLIAALAAPKVPSAESMAPPSAESLKHSESQLDLISRQTRATVPSVRTKTPIPLPSKSRTPTDRFGAVLPPPQHCSSLPPAPVTVPSPTISEKPAVRLNGRYVVIAGRSSI